MAFLRSAPWRRAPLLLLRRPVVALAVAGTCALLAVAAASGPLFLASVGASALQRTVAEQCPEADVPAVRRSDPQSAADIRRADAEARAALAATGLPAPYRVTVAQPIAQLGRDPQPQQLTFYGRADALDHVQKVRASAGAGLWISDREAERRNVRLGDTVVVGSVRAPIVGVYRDLAGGEIGGELPSYWCSWSSLILPSLEFRPPPFLIADEPTMDRIATELAGRNTVVENTARPTWYSAGPADRLTLTEADDVLDRQSQLAVALRAVDPVSGDPGYLIGSGLADDRRAAGLTRDGVGGAILPVALAGVLVAVLLVAAAASFWVDQRRTEIRLLASRGVGPAGLAVKACLEMALPAVAGAAVGWAVAIGLIQVLGPSPRLEPGAPWSALATVLPALTAGMAALAAVAAVRSFGMTEPPRRAGAGWWRAAPWELILVVLGVVAYLGLRRSGAVTMEAGGVIKVDPLLVAFPLLGMTGLLLLLARGAATQLPRLRRWTRGASTPVYLAGRRLAGLRSATVAVLVATAVPVGILVYAASITRSMEATVSAKSATYAGAEHALVVNARPAQTLDLEGSGTQVSVVRDVVTPAGSDTEVLGVDPETFARYAFSDAAVIGRPLPELLAAITRPTSPDSVPAIAVRCRSCPAQLPMNLGRTRLSAQVVATADLFPGMRVRDAAVFVVPRAALARVDPYTNRAEEVWTSTAQLPAALDTLRRLDQQLQREVTPQQFLGVTQLLPVSWTFDYLQALASLTGLIAVVGLFLYLAARQRSTLVAYVMLRRIGITRRAHFVSLGSELGGVLTMSWLLGVATAVAAVLSVHRLLDVNPLYPPGALLVLPMVVVLLSIAVLLGVALLGSITTQRTADAVEPAVLLRGAP